MPAPAEAAPPTAASAAGSSGGSGIAKKQRVGRQGDLRAALAAAFAAAANLPLPSRVGGDGVRTGWRASSTGSRDFDDGGRGGVYETTMTNPLTAVKEVSSWLVSFRHSSSFGQDEVKVQ